jgi:GNAT superfamily N-acetyltransferase
MGRHRRPTRRRTCRAEEGGLSLNPALVRIHFDQDMRRFPAGPDGKVAPQPVHLSRHEGQIIWQDVPPSDFDRVIAEEMATARAAGLELEWKLYSHDAPVGLAQALTAAGFDQQPTEAIMVRDTDLGHAPEVVGLTVNKIQTLEDAKAAFDLLLDVFGNSREASPQSLLDRALTTQPFYLGRYNGVAVSCGRLDVPNGSAFGGLYGGATHKDYRRQGLYRPIVHARCEEARRLGCAYVFSEALPTSRPILEALGFAHLCDVTGFVLGARPVNHQSNA